MKKLFLILLSVLPLMVVAQQKIAFLEPRVGEGSTPVTAMEKNMVRGELRKAIVNFSGFEAITRVDIDQMMKEQNFQRTGMVSDAQIKKLGEMSGADYICVSTLTKSNTEFYLEAYLIHLETGRMSNPASQYGELTNRKLANMFPACKALAEELLGQNKSQQYKTQNQPLHGKYNATEQSSELEKDVVFKIVEVMPEFPGGTEALVAYLRENIKYPIYAQEHQIQGRAICQFVINKDGSISEVQVVRTTGDQSLDNEAIRLIKSMPRWEAGRQRGKAVRVYYTIPVNFKLQ